MPASDADPGAAPGPLHRDLALILLGAVAAAALFGLAFPGPGLWPLAVLSPWPLGWLALRRGRTWWTLAVVFVTHLAMWLATERWLASVTAVGYPLFALYLAVYPVAFVWLVGRVTRHPRLGRIPLALVVPVVWVGLECLRGRVILGGYPWFLLGHPFVELPILTQSADLVGAYGISFMAASVSGAGLDLLRFRAGRGRAIAAAVCVAAVIAADVVYGGVRLRESASIEPSARVIAIQTNVPQSNKIVWSPEDQARDVPEFIDLTRWALGSSAGPVDLIIWPETMLPGVGFEAETLGVLRRLGEHVEPLVVWQDTLIGLQAELGVPILAGSLAWVEPFREETDAGAVWRWRYEYNSAYLVGGDGPPFQRYDKVSLTPFGETMPLISRWPWLEERLLALGAEGMTFNLSAAESPRIIEVQRRDGATLRLATPICFEVTISHLCRHMAYRDGVKNADAFVNLSNDGWFGDSIAGRARHLQVARFRCIENRIPMVRAVNTGLSASIDSAGRVQERTAPRTAAAVMAELGVDDRSTVYGRVGDALAWFSLAALALAVAATFFRKAEA